MECSDFERGCSEPGDIIRLGGGYYSRPLPHWSYLLTPLDGSEQLDRVLRQFLVPDSDGHRPIPEARKLLRDWLAQHQREIELNRVRVRELIPTTIDTLEEIYDQGVKAWLFKFLSDRDFRVREAATVLWVESHSAVFLPSKQTLGQLHGSNLKAAAYQLAANCPMPRQVVPTILYIAVTERRAAEDVLEILIYFAANMPFETEEALNRTMRRLSEYPNLSRLPPNETSEIAQLVAGALRTERNLRSEQSSVPELHQGVGLQHAWAFFRKLRDRQREKGYSRSIFRELATTVGIIRGGQRRFWQKRDGTWHLTEPQKFAEIGASQEIPKESILDRLSEVKRRYRWKKEAEKLIGEDRA